MTKRAFLTNSRRTLLFGIFNQWCRGICTTDFIHCIIF